MRIRQYFTVWNSLHTYNIHVSVYNVYVTAGMDISAGSVPPGPNLTRGMEPGMNTNI